LSYTKRISRHISNIVYKHGRLICKKISKFLKRFRDQQQRFTSSEALSGGATPGQTPMMLSLEAVPRLEAASRQFFQVLVLVLVFVLVLMVLVLAVKALVLVVVLRVTVSVLVLVLAHTVLLTSRGFDNLTI